MASPWPGKVLLLFAVAAGIAAFGRAAGAPASPDEDRLLDTGAPVRRGLTAKEVHLYHVALERGEFVHVALEQIGIDVSVSFRSPAGNTLVEMDTPTGRYETEEVSCVAETPGIYGVEVRGLDESDIVGAYVITLRERRPATQRDRLRLSAEAAFVEASGLSQKEGADAQKRALIAFERALSLWREVGDRKYEAMTQVAMADIQHNYLNEAAKALELYEHVLPIWRETNDLPMEIFTLFGLGTAEYRLQRMQPAMDHYATALAAVRKLGDRRTEAQILSNLGMVSSAMGSKETALGYYDRALPLLRETGNREAEQYTLNNIGLLHDEQGEKQKALDFYREALTLCRKLGNRTSEAVVLSNLGRVFIELDQAATGLNYLRQSLVVSRELGDRGAEAVALMSIGESEMNGGMTSQARETYETALALFRETRNRRFEGIILQRLAEARNSAGEHDDALRLAQEALSLARVSANRYTEGRALTSIGIALAALGDNAKARESLLQAEHLQEVIADRFRLARTDFELARLERGGGDLEAARAHAEKAVELVESLRTEVISHDLRASFFGTVQAYYGLAVDVLLRMHEKEPRKGYDALALHANERARARSFLDDLAEARSEIRRGVDPPLLEREQASRKMLGARVDAQLRLMAGSANAEKLSLAAAEIEKLRTEHRELEERIREASPRYAALTQPRVLDLPGIQRELDDDTLLLEYSLGEERSFVWSVTSHSSSARALPSREKVETAARQLYELVTTRNRKERFEKPEARRSRIARADAAIPGAASTVARMLLPPADVLGKKRLVVVADGALQYVPFAALPGGEAGTPLAVDHEIVTLPSASVLAELRRDVAGRAPAPKMAAVLADPVFDDRDERLGRAGAPPRSQASTAVLQEVLRSAVETGASGEPDGRLPRLRFSRQEAMSILKLVSAGEGRAVLDFDASLVTVTGSDLDQYRIVHFATHSLLNTIHPDLSGIVLSLVDRKARPIPGFLSAGEIFNLKLPAELVVLSGCQTALGREIRGEGLVGLTRGFFYAGAARVVSSLWKVNDAATAELMTRFYRGMLGREHLRPAAALRQAQVEMWKEGLHRAPYHWAAFVLQGEWK